jgi:hypothetical protein
MCCPGVAPLRRAAFRTQYNDEWFPAEQHAFVAPDEHAGGVRHMEERRKKGTGLGGTAPLGNIFTRRVLSEICPLRWC